MTVWGAECGLEEMGISKQEIVIGFHYPALRQHSEYAVS
ncbi:element excision factor XisI family protein [Dolichospermum circinale]|nr:element excision factor XisI family protein [Dolichospermum circinale]MDB9449312.1 element excision factor XisI family protein [Dolichospermum circinale CS-547]